MNALAEEFARCINNAVKHHSDVFNKTDWAKVPIQTFFVGGLRIDLETLRLIECANVVHVLGGSPQIEIDDPKLAQYLQQYFPHFDVIVSTKITHDWFKDFQSKGRTQREPQVDPDIYDWTEYDKAQERINTRRNKPPLGKMREFCVDPKSQIPEEEKSYYKIMDEMKKYTEEEIEKIRKDWRKLYGW